MWLKKKYLTEDDRKFLAEKIADVEKTTSGEIRVVFRHRRQRKERNLSMHDLALREFFTLGMEKTRDRTGVLLLILLSERQFRIIGDEGIHTKVGDGQWERIAGQIAASFKEGKYRQGIADALDTVGRILALHFPRKADDTNELPNDIIER